MSGLIFGVDGEGKGFDRRHLDRVSGFALQARVIEPVRAVENIDRRNGEHSDLPAIPCRQGVKDPGETRTDEKEREGPQIAFLPDAGEGFAFGESDDAGYGECVEQEVCD